MNKINNLTFDVGGSSIKFIHFDNENKIIEQQEISYNDFKKSEKKPLKYVLNLIDEKISNYDFDFNLGLALPGIIDPENFKIKVESAISEIDIDIKDFFSHNKKIKKLIIENDAKSAAFAEFKVRTNISNMIHVTIGTGIGGGIIINKKIYGGTKNYAGEFSKLFASIQKNNQTVHKVLSTTQNCLLYPEEEISGKKIIELCQINDSKAIEIVENWTNALANFLLNLDYIYSPDLITVGGGISDSRYFMDILFKKYKDNRMEKNAFTCKIEKANFKNEAGCYGINFLLKE